MSSITRRTTTACSSTCSAGVATGTGGITNIQDVLGSGQGDVLVGDGTGVELVETAGRNLMIGGSGGGATLQSGDGQDIVIAGSTNYDDKHDALAAIEAYWSNTANGTFTQRADALSAGIPGGYVLDSFTVLTHSARRRHDRPGFRGRLAFLEGHGGHADAEREHSGKNDAHLRERKLNGVAVEI